MSTTAPSRGAMWRISFAGLMMIISGGFSVLQALAVGVYPVWGLHHRGRPRGHLGPDTHGGDLRRTSEMREMSQVD
jgi:hypothetical protein